LRKEKGENEFTNAVRNQVETAAWESICYLLKKDIHEFQQGIEQRAKMTVGKIFFKGEKIRMIDPGLPAESLLLKRAEEADNSEDFNKNLEKEIQA